MNIASVILQYENFSNEYLDVLHNAFTTMYTYFKSILEIARIASLLWALAGIILWLSGYDSQRGKRMIFEGLVTFFVVNFFLIDLIDIFFNSL
ncbi:MAG: hypothetical protein ACP6IU_01055 [Candidatus Asgardarchaeia archaeon]|nr:hypothetical protein [Candidatus Odinarchaeota archaeon]RLI63363.1 MAG: hypothetical protein DRO67_05835 [Candidatus Asgardarchaeum californiense]